MKKSIEAPHLMKPFLFFSILLTLSSAFAADAMKFVSPDKMSTLIVELKTGKKVHRLFYEDLESTFKPRIAEAFNASLNKIGKIVLPTFSAASLNSPDELEIKANLR